MDDATYRQWDIRLKKSDLRLKLIAPLLAALLAVAGLLAGLWQFGKEQNAQRERQTELLVQNAKHDFNLRMWEKQLGVYMNFTRAVGKIAAGNQSRKQLDEDIKEFLVLYWGEMIYFEDDAVRDASKTLRAEIEHYLEGGAKDSTQLKKVAENLIRTCRESSNKSLPPG
jgi:uncharacterized protein HemX